MRFVKGHGTENAFVLLPDPDAELDLTPARVRTLCDRRRGIGADGVLRVVRSAALADGEGGARRPEAEWFMDYRNADGTVAEMCGNGVRVFARYLRDAELVSATELVLDTRSGARRVRFEQDGEITVEMGPALVGPASTATINGVAFDGVAVDVGNPHLACVTETPLDSLDLAFPPGHDPALFPHGVNVEFVTPLRDGEVAIRVHERGVGETRSCGTGTVAGVVAALRQDGRLTGSCAVITRGGRLRVTVTQEGSMALGTALTGPAVLVASGEIDAEWWRSAG